MEVFMWENNLVAIYNENDGNLIRLKSSLMENNL